MNHEPLPCAFLITDTKTTEPLAAASKLPRNAGIILRDYDLSYDARLKLGRELKKICITRKLILLVANSPQLALELKADGVHFPEYAAPQIHRWRSKKPQWIITAAVHSRFAAKFAINNGADAVLISPIYNTPSHPGKKPLGAIKAAKLIYIGQNHHLCAYGLGGVKPHHAKHLQTLGFVGFAGISWGANCAPQATVKRPPS